MVNLGVTFGDENLDKHGFSLHGEIRLMPDVVKLEILHENNNEEVTIQGAYEVKCSTDVEKECSPDSSVCGVHICYGALSWCGNDAKKLFL